MVVIENIGQFSMLMLLQQRKNKDPVNTVDIVIRTVNLAELFQTLTCSSRTF